MSPTSGSEGAFTPGHAGGWQREPRGQRDFLGVATERAGEACAAGVDIYLQKPMTLYPDESLAVRNAVRRHRRICQIGTQVHASENFRRVVEFVRSGKLGHIGAMRTFHVLNQGVDGLVPFLRTTGLDPSWFGSARRTRLEAALRS